MVNYSRIIGEVMLLMEKPSVYESPLRQGTRLCPIWDLAETEACGSGKVLSMISWFFLEFMGIYRRKTLGKGRPRVPQAWMARPPPGRGVGACGAPEAPLPWLPSFPIFFRLRKNLFGDFLPFGLRFKISSERGQKHGKNRNWHLLPS